MSRSNGTRTDTHSTYTQYFVLRSVLLSYTTHGACGFIDLEARASAAVPYRRRLSESPPCAQRAPHPPPRAARQPPAPARAQSRGQAWGWRHSTPWSGASPCLSPADTHDALLRLPERVTVPRNSTGSSSAPKCRQRRVHSHIGDGQNDGDARRLGLGRVRCRAQVVNCSSSAPLVVTWIS